MQKQQSEHLVLFSVEENQTGLERNEGKEMMTGFNFWMNYPFNLLYVCADARNKHVLI